MANIYTNSGALFLANAVKTALLATSTMHLFKSAFTPGPTTTLADLAAIEADFEGYAESTIATWLAAFIDPAGGATIIAPTRQFACTGDATPNDIYGGWIETAVPGLVCVFTFSEPLPIQDVGNAVNVTVGLNFGRSDDVEVIVEYAGV